MRPYVSTKKNNTLFYILLLLALLNVETAYARTYFVSSRGNDFNSGLSRSTPFKTINNALSRVWESGDTIYVMSGTYVETLYIWQSGITLAAFPGHSPIIDGRSFLPDEDWGSLISVEGNNNSISGFELKNSNTRGKKRGGNGIEVGGHHNTISHINVHHTWEQGILIHGDYNIVEDSTIWQAALQNSHNEGQDSITWSAGLSAARNNSPSALTPGITSYAIFRRNTVFNNWGEGISCFEADYCTMEDNTIYDNWTINLYLSDATNSIVKHNLIYISATPAIPFRNHSNVGILLADEVASAPRSAYNKIINNLISNANFEAFTWTGVTNSGLNNVLIENNTIVDGNLSTGGLVENVINRNSQIINNIILGKNSNIPNKKGITFSNNKWPINPK